MSYLGSKAASGVYQKIIAEMPPHDVYIETHLGGGAVMLRKPPAKVNFGIDIDPQTIEAFNQGNPEFLDTLGDSLFIDVGDAVDFLEASCGGTLPMEGRNWKEWGECLSTPIRLISLRRAAALRAIGMNILLKTTKDC